MPAIRTQRQCVFGALLFDSLVWLFVALESAEASFVPKKPAAEPPKDLPPQTDEPFYFRWVVSLQTSFFLFATWNLCQFP